MLTVPKGASQNVICFFCLRSLNNIASQRKRLLGNGIAGSWSKIIMAAILHRCWLLDFFFAYWIISAQRVKALVLFVI
jgi:hypothetical protein